MQYRVLNVGDRAITFEFGNVISKQVSHHVLGVHGQIKELISLQNIVGLIESVPTFRSLTVHFDPLKLFPEDVEALVAPYIKASAPDLKNASRWSFPVCYEGEYAPDLDEVAKVSGLSRTEIIELHCSQVYDVFMLGFLPGFAFMGILDQSLRLPRRKEPRTAVPQGSVAIADQLTAIYPSVSPGGWNLIGRTPVRLFDANSPAPALLKAGDQVGFHRVDAAEFKQVQALVSAGDYTCHNQFRLGEVS